MCFCGICDHLYKASTSIELNYLVYNIESIYIAQPIRKRKWKKFVCDDDDQICVVCMWIQVIFTSSNLPIIYFEYIYALNKIIHIINEKMIIWLFLTLARISRNKLTSSTWHLQASQTFNPSRPRFFFWFGQSPLPNHTKVQFYFIILWFQTHRWLFVFVKNHDLTKIPYVQSNAP